MMEPAAGTGEYHTVHTSLKRPRIRATQPANTTPLCARCQHTSGNFCRESRGIGEHRRPTPRLNNVTGRLCDISQELVDLERARGEKRHVWLACCSLVGVPHLPRRCAAVPLSVTSVVLVAERSGHEVGVWEKHGGHANGDISDDSAVC